MSFSYNMLHSNSVYSLCNFTHGIYLDRFKSSASLSPGRSQTQCACEENYKPKATLKSRKVSQRRKTKMFRREIEDKI